MSKGLIATLLHICDKTIRSNLHLLEALPPTERGEVRNLTITVRNLVTNMSSLKIVIRYFPVSSNLEQSFLQLEFYLLCFPPPSRCGAFLSNKRGWPLAKTSKILKRFSGYYSASPPSWAHLD